jgi:Sulfotransferase domain
MRFVNVSPHRSGTQSVTAFCQAHGLKALHWQGLAFEARCVSRGVAWEVAKPLLGAADVASDLPWPIVYSDVAATTDARFFLVRRKPAAWIRSVRGMMAGRPMGPLERLFYRELTGRPETSIDGYSAAEIESAYCRFLGSAKRDLGARLTLFDLEDPALADKLARYFGFARRVEMERLK